MLKDASLPLTIAVLSAFVKCKTNNEDLSRLSSGEHTCSTPIHDRYRAAFKSVKMLKYAHEILCHVTMNFLDSVFYSKC
jgi:hypothetical protein